MKLLSPSSSLGLLILHFGATFFTLVPHRRVHVGASAKSRTIGPSAAWLAGSTNGMMAVWDINVQQVCSSLKVLCLELPNCKAVSPLGESKLSRKQGRKLPEGSPQGILCEHHVLSHAASVLPCTGVLCTAVLLRPALDEPESPVISEGKSRPVTFRQAHGSAAPQPPRLLRGRGTESPEDSWTV